MEQLMQEVRDYAEAVGVKPTTVLQVALGVSHTTWSKWEAGGSCTLRTAEKLRAYMADNSPGRAA